MSSEVRQQAIHPASSYLVQAPAGSGKTELLTQRILALLAIVDEPEEILALTFTRKAAAEMRNRVIDALNMPKPEDSHSHKMATWQLADKALARSRERDWNLCEHPARLRIMTLDSLTGSLARQLPLLSGLGDIPTPSEHSSVAYREAAERTLQAAIRDDLPAVESLLLHQDHNSVAVIDSMVTMLGNRDQWLKYIAGYRHNIDHLKQTIEANLADYLTFQIQVSNAHMPIDARAALPELIRFAGHELDDENLSAFDSWPEVTVTDIRAWKTIANVLLTTSGPQFKKRLDKNSGFPTSAKVQKQQMQELLTQLSSIAGLAESLHQLRALPDSAAFEPKQWEVAEALFELLPKAVVELKAHFSSNGEADFTEIAMRALEALIDADENPTDLLLKLDYRINHILVDEFQDTSELQMRLMQCLTAGWQHDDGRTLFMVGDPMQSIYRFRKAEVGLFLQAAANHADLPQVEMLRLERNFRSSPDIVDWVNRAFSQIFPSQQDAISGAIAHANADAALTNTGIVALHRQVASDDKQQDDTREAAAVVALVREALSKKQRVGILARTRKHLHAIIPALSEAGIAHRAINILPLNTRPEIRGLRTLVRALLHPADHESWLALLRAPYCGLNTEELFTLLHGDERVIWEVIEDDEARSRLNSDTAVRVRHLARALKPCMTMSSKIALRELATIAWQRLGMPALLDQTATINVETLFALIESLDESGRINFRLLDERIEKLFAAPDASNAAAQVELLTMHGAKGLQWECVILPGLGKAPKNSDQPLLAFSDAAIDGKPLFLMSPKAETRNKDQLYSMVLSIEKAKETNELARLLYVACTRAESELHMLGNLSKAKQEPEKGSPLAMLLSSDECFGAQINDIESSDEVVERALQPLTRIKQLPDLPPEQVSEEHPEPEYGWAGPEAAPIGNALHAILQQIGEQGVESWSQADQKHATTAMRRMLIGEGLSSEMLESSLNRCLTSLKKTLDSKMGRWILSGHHEDVHCEWALSFIENGQVCHRIIDRSFIDEEGVRWIIDYKSGTHEGAELNNFLDSEEQRYATQLIGYRELLVRMEPERTIRLALYFPALDAWREITKQS